MTSCWLGMKIERLSSKMQNFCMARTSPWQTRGQPNLAPVVLPPFSPILPSRFIKVQTLSQIFTSLTELSSDFDDWLTAVSATLTFALHFISQLPPKCFHQPQMPSAVSSKGFFHLGSGICCYTALPLIRTNCPCGLTEQQDSDKITGENSGGTLWQKDQEKKDKMKKMSPRCLRGVPKDVIKVACGWKEKE